MRSRRPRRSAVTHVTPALLATALALPSMLAAQQVDVIRGRVVGGDG